MKEGEYIALANSDGEHQLTETPIVRCRDCRFWATERRFFGYCVGKEFNPNGFCSWGKRKESDE